MWGNPEGFPSGWWGRVGEELGAAWGIPKRVSFSWWGMGRVISIVVSPRGIPRSDPWGDPLGAICGN
jgi:hypothetical protein